MTRQKMLLFAAYVVLPVAAFLLVLGYRGAFTPETSGTLATLEKRAAEFNTNLQTKNYGAMWDMMLDKSGDTREEYIQYLTKGVGEAAIEVKGLGVRRVNGKLGVALANIKVTPKGESMFEACDGVVWIWNKDNWFFFRNFACEHEQEVVDMMMKYKDIRNAPK